MNQAKIEEMRAQLEGDMLKYAYFHKDIKQIVINFHEGGIEIEYKNKFNPTLPTGAPMPRLNGAIAEPPKTRKPREKKADKVIEAPAEDTKPPSFQDPVMPPPPTNGGVTHLHKGGQGLDVNPSVMPAKPRVLIGQEPEKKEEEDIPF